MRTTTKKLENAVTQIASQAKVSVAYSKEFVDTKQLVSISVKNASLKEALNNLLKKTNIGYSISGDKLLLFDRKIGNTKDPIKKVKVRGQVTDQVTAEPMVGVSILVKGGKEGTITDIDGNYTLSVPSDKAVLVYSYIGYTSQEVTVGQQSTINILLKEDAQALDEVVVVGYGVVKKRDLVGSIASVKSQDITAHAR